MSTEQQIQKTIVILRHYLDHRPRSDSIGDEVLRPYAVRLHAQVEAGDSELAVRSAVAKIQEALRLPIVDQLCRDVASRLNTFAD
jgi:hypothetical protein